MKTPITPLLIITLVCSLLACSNPKTETEDVAVVEESPTVEVEYLNPPDRKDMNLPFSEAVKVGNTLYLSGQIGMDYTTGVLAEGGIKAETDQTLKNIQKTLQRYGADIDDIVKCTIFLADIEEWPLMNEAYVPFFTKHFPARSAMAGSGLAMGARVEIECIAVIK